MALPVINRHLMQLALQRTKQAFVPSAGAAGAPPDPSAGGAPPMDPSAGGAPPMDPSMGGGAPPPPMDPAMMGGGAPPMDPSMGGGGMGGADLDAKIQRAVQQALQVSGMGAAGGNGGPGSPKQPKPDINTIATDIFQLKKMFLAYLRRQGIELPPDILDGPNRDPATGAPAVSPTGGSDVAPGSSQASAAGAIPPIAPVQPATMNAISGGGAPKTASALSPAQMVKEAAELLGLWALYLEHKENSRDAWELLSKEAATPEDLLSVGRPVPRNAPTQAVRSQAAALAMMFRNRG